MILINKNYAASAKTAETMTDKKWKLMPPPVGGGRGYKKEGIA